MADSEALNKFFAPPDASLPQDVLAELLHILQLMSLTPEDLYYKWDSYVITMGADTTKLDHKTVRDFKKTLQDAFERDSRKSHATQHVSKRTAATPRATAGGGDVFGMLDGMLSTTPASRSTAATKRKGNNFDTPASKSVRNGLDSSPADSKTPASTTIGAAVPFEERQNAGTIIESLNSHLPAATLPDVPPTESRVKLRAANDLPKFAYKSMAMKLSEASEILDDRIDTFTDRVQQHYELPDSAFGNPAAQSSAEIVAVGRIACDMANGKLNAASMVLETSRRMGAGMRVPLRVDNIGYDFFPGKIVALRGANVSGEYFAVTEILPMPLLPPAASIPSDIDMHNDRLTSAAGETSPLNILIASGPYTTDADLSFAALHALLDHAATTKPDALILSGPFLDLEHPAIASGDFEPHLPPNTTINPDRATLSDVFRALIAAPLQKLAAACPTCTIILIPSLRDAISKHVSWPQDRIPRAGLGLPAKAQFVANPMTLFLNEMVVGISSQDVLSELRAQNVYAPPPLSQQQKQTPPPPPDFLARLAAHVIEQSHYFPVFPPTAREDAARPAPIPGEVVAADPSTEAQQRLATGASLDLTYLKLGEFLRVRPDVLILPSALNPFAKVVDSVLCLNPGSLSKKRGAGTYVSVSVGACVVHDEARGESEVAHRVWERARVDVVRV